MTATDPIGMTPMHQTRQASDRLPLTAMAMGLFAVMVVVGIALRPVMPIDETRYLTVAWEMRSYGNWIVPHLNGDVYGDKPPLLFWLINLVWSVTGPSEFAARLIAPAFGLGAIWTTSALGRALYPDRPELGGYAALALAGMAGFAFFAGLTMFDGMLTLATALGVLALVYGVKADPQAPGGWQPWACFGAALALGVICKGPVILVHLLPVALTMPLWAKIPLRHMLRGVGLGLLVAVGLVALWLVPALLLGGAAYREEILWTQSAGRVVSSFAHQKPIWFFLPLLPLLTWPWSWSAGFWRNLSLRGPMPIWIVATVLIFSLISGKQIHYLLPMLPAVALLAAPALAQGARAPLAAIFPIGAGLYLLGLAFGLIKGEAALVFGPTWLVTVLGLAMLGIAALALIRRGPELALLAPLGIVVLSGLFLGTAGQAYDARIIGRILAPHDVEGIATLDSGYAGEFGFAGRLGDPVVRLDDDVAGAEEWLAAHNGRILFGRMDRAHPTTTPTHLIGFRGRDYGLWVSPKDNAQTTPEVQ